MKIYTRGGDEGQTALFGGSRIAKSDSRVCAYGEVDELNSFLGVAIAFMSADKLQPCATALQEVQNRLFDLGAELATAKQEHIDKMKRRVTLGDVQTLEKQIDDWQELLPPLKNFILPGGSQAAAHLHLARTVCRRAERSVESLSQSAHLSPELLKYLNRLSDYLFVMARYANHVENISEPLWQQ